MSDFQPSETTSIVEKRGKTPGRFEKGGLPGPGRPRGSIRREFLAVLHETVTRADWVKIVEKAVAQATRGDSAARAWLGRYLLGTGELTNRLVLGEVGQRANGGIRIREVIVELARGQTERFESQPGELPIGEPGESGGTS